MLPLAVSLALSLAPPAPAADPDPAGLLVPPDKDADARELVTQLADPRFPVREAAHRGLRDLGRFALPAIQDALDHAADPELARRCELLYPHVFALDLKARVDCFVADAAGRYKHHLPGEEEFFAAAGRSAAARVLYRDLMLSPNRHLITAVARPEEEVLAAAALRRAELVPARGGGGVRQASAEDVLAVLFAEASVPDRGPGGAGVLAPTYLLTQSQLRAALDADPRKEAMAAVVARWFDTRTDPRTVQMCLNVAATFKVPAAPLARRVLAAEGATPQQKGTAVSKLAQAGDPADLALLAPLFADDAVSYTAVAIVNGVRQNQQIQVRDTALAMSVLLAKQDPADYGLKARYANQPNETLKYTFYNYYFEQADDAQGAAREAAHKKWGEYAAKNLKGYTLPAFKKKDEAK